MTRKDLDSMNYVKIGIIISILLLSWTGDVLFAQQENAEESLISEGSFFENIVSRRRVLFVKTELLRFLNDKGQTEFNLNYKIPNNELQFIETEQGWICSLSIEFNIYKNGNLVSPNKFDHFAGAGTTAIAQSANHYVLDKISLTLGKPGFTAELKIVDKNSSTSHIETFDLSLLDNSVLVSDIEISHGISTELSPALEKFQRSKYQFYVDPNPVLDSNNKDFIAYYQVSNISAGADSLHRFFEYVRVIKDSVVVWKAEFNNTVEFLPYPVIKKIPLSQYEPGLYTLKVEIVDPKSQKSEIIEKNFSVTRKYIVFTQRIFSDDEDEFALISYFIDNNQKRIWRGLESDGKKRFIERFWTANNPNPNSESNQFLDVVRLRVNEANWRFSYHRDGWKTDLGRVYIKLGSPDEIDKSTTGADAHYSRKDFQIWKYHNLNRNYLFFDFQGNGNYQLIYSKNDETERSDNNWKTYFEEEFDTSRVEN